MMYTVVETVEFRAWAAKVWKDDERTDFINAIAADPEAGVVIEKSGSCRKVRWSRQGMGKRSGARVIYFNRLDRGEVVLLIVYAKAKFDNLPTAFLKKLKERFDGKKT
jgi:hypothetical protein